MTGYLQRLVTTAVQGQTGVRPVVRPRESGRAEDPAAWTELGDDAWSSGAATATSSAAPEVADPRAHISDLPGPGASGTGGQPRAVPRTGRPLSEQARRTRATSRRHPCSTRGRPRPGKRLQVRPDSAAPPERRPVTGSSRVPHRK